MWYSDDCAGTNRREWVIWRCNYRMRVVVRAGCFCLPSIERRTDWRSS